MENLCNENFHFISSNLSSTTLDHFDTMIFAHFTFETLPIALKNVYGQWIVNSVFASHSRHKVLYTKYSRLQRHPQAAAFSGSPAALHTLGSGKNIYIQVLQQLS
jgi:hypothetical protein